VLVDGSRAPRALGALLTALVPAATDGLVREVLVVGASGIAREIADDAGARLADDLCSAVSSAKGPWMVWLPAGAGLAAGWMEAMRVHVESAGDRPARLVDRRRLFGRSLEGWLSPKPALSACVAQQDLQRIVRGLGRRRLRVLERA
jgi:hypothetical protein